MDKDLSKVLDNLDNTRAQALDLLNSQRILLTKAHQTQKIADDTAPSTPSENEMRYARQQSTLLAQTTQLRGLYRNAVMSIRTTKAATADARSEVDTLHLALQNLIYQQQHLRGEIEACESYDHKYKNLPLIPTEDYLSRFPDGRELPEHDLMIARIKYEHAERQALEEKRQGLLKRKQGLIAENNRRKEDLANLDEDLENFIEAAGPIIKTFEKEY